MRCLVRFRPSDCSSWGPGTRGDLLVRLLALATCLPLAGCVAVGATLAGLGFTQQIGGIQYRTFTEPLPKVSRATLTAFRRMDLKLDTVEPTKTGELIKATAADRRFEVELEALTGSTTRMRAMAKNQMGVIVDASTAQEIIRQAEKALEPESMRKRARNQNAVTPKPQS